MLLAYYQNRETKGAGGVGLVQRKTSSHPSANTGSPGTSAMRLVKAKNREEFQKHCDQYGTRKEILAKLM
jgi:hypothetical protein